jgi:hypothetical protein
MVMTSGRIGKGYVYMLQTPKRWENRSEVIVKITRMTDYNLGTLI